MTRSGYVAELRKYVGHLLIILPSVTLFIFDSTGRVLFMRHTDGGLWAPPGGMVEPGETPADAVVREAREEIGVEATPTDLMGVFGGPEFNLTYDNGDQVNYVMIAFRCIIDGHPTPDGLEVHEARYVNRQEWKALNTSPWVAYVIPHVFDWVGSDPRNPMFTPPSDKRPSTQ